MKYFSMVARWVVGGDCVRRWIMWEISAGGFSMMGVGVGWRGGGWSGVGFWGGMVGVEGRWLGRGGG